MNLWFFLLEEQLPIGVRVFLDILIDQKEDYFSQKTGMAANTWKKGVHYIIIVIDALARVDQEILLKVLISYYFTVYSVSH